MNDIAKKDPVKRVRTALNLFDKNLKIQILENSARTALDASKALDCEVGAIVKSLVLRRKNSFLICLVSGDKKCSLNKVKKILAEKDVCLADAEQVKEISGFTIGGVSPIGHLNKIEILIDLSLERFDELFAAAGHPNCIFKICFEDLSKITNGSIRELVELDNQNY